MTTLKELAVDHPYYASDTNYYSNDAAWVIPSGSHETMSDFLDEFENSDVDMNLVYRWDVKERCDEDTDEPLGHYYAEIFIIGQRKGLYLPQYVAQFDERDADRFVSYLKKHWLTIQALWLPITQDKGSDV